MTSMQNRSKVINRLALVLLSIVVLELILIGDPVQPVKAIKKKIALKKLKKILPLLALIKPKKKLILVPIPIPMFKKPGHKYPYATSQHNHQMMGTGQAMTADGTVPMSFVMEPNLTGSLGPSNTMQLMPMSMVESTNVLTPASSPTLETPMTMMMPSMTMTISSDGGGATMSAIELSATNRPMASANASSGALLAQSRPNKYHEQQQVLDNFDNEWANNEGLGGEYYYSSPWSSNRQPLTSPAKLLRSERPRQTRPQNNEPMVRPTSQRPQQAGQVWAEGMRGQQSSQAITMRPALQQQSHFRPTGAQPSNAVSGRLKQPLRQQQQQQSQFPAPMPVIIIKNQWTSSKATQAPAQQLQQKSRRQNDRIQQQQQQHLTPLQEQQINQALEYEELIPLGPPQLMPIYQTPNGRLHMTPPTPTQTNRPPSDSASLQSPSSDSASNSFEHEHEHDQAAPAPAQSSTPAQPNYNDQTNSEIQNTGHSEPGASRFQPMTTLASTDQDEVQTMRPPPANTQPTNPHLSPSHSGRVTLKGKQQQQPNDSKRNKQPVVAGGY